jgi:RNA recognition motif-containing protein
MIDIDVKVRPERGDNISAIECESPVPFLSSTMATNENPLTEGFDSNKSVFVTNIDLEVQEAHLKQLFGFCGELAKLKFLSYTLASPFKACLLEFKDSSAVETALMLSNTPLLGRVISVLPSDLASAVPASNDASSMAAHAHAAVAAASAAAAAAAASSQQPAVDPLLLAAQGILMPPLLMVPSLVMPSSASSSSSLQPVPSASSSSSLTSALLPLPVPLNAVAAGVAPTAHVAPNQQTPDEVLRTIYVGNLSPSTTNADVMRQFGCCGPVTMIRISGNQAQTDATRYAFVEFTTVEAARLAVERMSGSVLAGMPLRVSTAKNPIVKPSLSMDLLPPPEAKRKLKDRLRRLNDKLAGGDARNRSRSRSPRNRSRSRSPRR